jgi:hypothetical protein
MRLTNQAVEVRTIDSSELVMPEMEPVLIFDDQYWNDRSTDLPNGRPSADLLV